MANAAPALHVPAPADPGPGAAILSEIEALILRHLVLPAHAAVATALWVLHTYALDVLYFSPRLLIVSPAPECGKTCLLTLLNALVHRPAAFAEVTAAVLFRLMHDSRPTLLADEADVWFPARSDVRTVLHSGYSRTFSHIARCEKTEDGQWGVVRFDCFGAMAWAMIGQLDAPTRSRGIEIFLMRKLPGEQREDLRADLIMRELAPLRARIEAWTSERMKEVGDANPAIPAGIGNRQADLWRPLFAIADLAGGEWPDRARKSAIVLGRAPVADESDLGVPLLRDTRSYFRTHEVDRVPSAHLLKWLYSIEDGPWREYRSGRPITARGLAELFRRFRIVGRTIRLDDGSTPKGYLKAQFDEAFARFLPATPPQARDAGAAS